MSPIAVIEAGARFFSRATRRRLAALLFPLVPLAACVAPGPPPESLTACYSAFHVLDEAVAATGVNDAEAARVSGFPYLRIDRLLASFSPEQMAPPAFAQWWDRLHALDRDGRSFEIQNLPPADGLSTRESRDDCSKQLRQLDLSSDIRQKALQKQAVVPDEYRSGWRILGLYPITALFVSQGIRTWHAQTHATFAKSLTELPVTGSLVRYVPARTAARPPQEIAALLARTSNNSLAIPEPQGTDRAALFASFAPVFEVDVVGAADEIGTPYWGGATAPQVDIADPVVYQRLSHVRLHGRILLQLNYIIWFPARPRTGPFDILGGELDGITWRVTLAPDGHPLLYDSMHNCGCYHMFFPTATLKLTPEAGDELLEPPLVPQVAPAVATDEAITLRLAARTHYLERIYTQPRPVAGTAYRTDDYARLRSLPRADGTRRSLFGPRGIVPGTARAERWLLWPMGIPAPGAMRQWGHHATAFVGRRHFDDPYLIERLFAPVSPP